jgi:hypothetical protein
VHSVDSISTGLKRAVDKGRRLGFERGSKRDREREREREKEREREREREREGERERSTAELYGTWTSLFLSSH